MGIHVVIQTTDFDVNHEYQTLRNPDEPYGAIVTFVGLVRDFSDQSLQAIELECYESMAQKILESIAETAYDRFDVSQLSVIHRTGRLLVSDQIVFIGVSAKHRRSAFDCANFVMDFLKTKAPFWKKEITTTDEHWVEMKESDSARRRIWE